MIGKEKEGEARKRNEGKEGESDQNLLDSSLV
jgi:hypothetical protein